MSIKYEIKKLKVCLRFFKWLIIGLIIIMGLLILNNCICGCIFSLDNIFQLFKYIKISKPSFSLIVSILALLIAIFGFRFQIISMINKHLTEMASLCNSNIDTKTKAIIETTQNVSHLISTIIATKQLLDVYFRN